MSKKLAEKVIHCNRIRYLSSVRRCALGCKTRHPLHKFPKNPSKRAEWFKILGIYSNKKYLYLCGAHFPENYTFGNRINTHILPLPPGISSSIVNNRNTNSETPNQTVILENNSITDEQETQTSIPESSHDSDDKQNQTVTPEVFELRNPSSRNNIIMGSYYETDDFIMASYTQTNKLTHQQQVFLLNQKFDWQSKILKQLEKENYYLTKAVRRHQILFSQLRKIKKKNGTLRKNIKKLEVKAKQLEKRLQFRQTTNIIY